MVGVNRYCNSVIYFFKLPGFYFPLTEGWLYSIVMVTPLSVVSETFAGGLGLLDLSCCAYEVAAENKAMIKTVENILFIINNFE